MYLCNQSSGRAAGDATPAGTKAPAYYQRGIATCGSLRRGNQDCQAIRPRCLGGRGSVTSVQVWRRRSPDLMMHTGRASEAAHEGRIPNFEDRQGTLALLQPPRGGGLRLGASEKYTGRGAPCLSGDKAGAIGAILGPIERAPNACHRSFPSTHPLGQFPPVSSARAGAAEARRTSGPPSPAAVRSDASSQMKVRVDDSYLPVTQGDEDQNRRRKGCDDG